MAIFKKQLITTNEDHYSKELQKYQNYLHQYDIVKKRWQIFLEVDLSEVNLSLESAFKTITKLYKERWNAENLLGLSGVRLMDLKEVNVSALMSDLDKLRLMKTPEPDKEDYKSYTTTPEENERLKVAKDFKKMLPYLKKSQIQFQNPMMAPIKVNGEINKYFIKTIR
jgi:hypothetical protein